MQSKGQLRSSSLHKIGLVVIMALVLGFVAAVLAGSPARANPGVGTPASPTSCPNQGYNTSTTIANCRPTTTTTAPGAFTLSASYKNGRLTWKACGGAQGSTVNLYVDGNPVDTGTIEGSGCTGQRNSEICLAAGSHTVVAMDGGQEATQKITVQNSGCHGPTAASASAGQAGGLTTGSTGGAKASGFLAFTGANIALVVLIAVLLIGLGYAIFTMSRQRRHAS